MKANLNEVQLTALLSPPPLLSAARQARTQQIIELHYSQAFSIHKSWWQRFWAPLSLGAVAVLSVTVVIVYHHYSRLIELNSLQYELNSLNIPEEQFM